MNLSLKQNSDAIQEHLTDKRNPHGVTPEQIGAADRDHSHSVASATKDGFMKKEDFDKLSKIAANANNYQHPATHPASIIRVADADGLLEATDVEAALKEVMLKANSAFQSASEGKEAIATALTGLGKESDSSETFKELAVKISEIDVGSNSHNVMTFTKSSGSDMLVLRRYGYDKATGKEFVSFSYGTSSSATMSKTRGKIDKYITNPTGGASGPSNVPLIYHQKSNRWFGATVAVWTSSQVALYSVNHDTFENSTYTIDNEYVGDTANVFMYMKGDDIYLMFFNQEGLLKTAKFAISADGSATRVGSIVSFVGFTNGSVESVNVDESTMQVHILNSAWGTPGATGYYRYTVIDLATMKFVKQVTEGLNYQNRTAPFDEYKTILGEDNLSYITRTGARITRYRLHDNALLDQVDLTFSFMGFEETPNSTFGLGLSTTLNGLLFEKGGWIYIQIHDGNSGWTSIYRMKSDFSAIEHYSAGAPMQARAMDKVSKEYILTGAGASSSDYVVLSPTLIEIE
jgi:hypothetical protein